MRVFHDMLLVFCAIIMGEMVEIFVQKPSHRTGIEIFVLVAATVAASILVGWRWDGGRDDR